MRNVETSKWRNVETAAGSAPVVELLRHSQVRVVFAAGSVSNLGTIAVEEGATRVLLVTDPGLVAAGHADRAAASLREAGVEVTIFHGIRENPTTGHVMAGVQVAQQLGIDFIVGLGGGSAMDCAKGINFILTNGGRMQDYWGVGKATKPMLPLIAVPTTAGTGSEAQSFALITDPATHQKMACGDKKALARVAILDPDLIRTVPRTVAAATGIDAVSHAVETAGTNKRTDVSRALSREAWSRLEPAFEGYYRDSDQAAAREAMLLGAHLAGAAIEASMLGAAHACANPLTAKYGTVHGIAVGLLLPHVVRYNAAVGENPYADLDADAGRLADRIDRMLLVAGLPRRLRDIGAAREDLDDLAAVAARQWTAGFNPRPVDQAELRTIYASAFE